MIYLSTFHFPTEEAEWLFFAGFRQTCYDSFYPFQIFPQRGLHTLDFAEITILYGGNGSGKSTLLRNIQAELQKENIPVYYFNNADPDEVRKFFDEAMALGVEGMMISPGFPYDKAPNQEIFLERKKTVELFRKILCNPKPHWVFNHSPGFLAFLKGEQEYDCTPWGNPTYSLDGWQKPCYLINDGYCETFAELMAEMDNYSLGPNGKQPECKDCMLHSGYEASAVRDIFGSFGGLIRAAKHQRNFSKKTDA